MNACPVVHRKVDDLGLSCSRSSQRFRGLNQGKETDISHSLHPVKETSFGWRTLRGEHEVRSQKSCEGGHEVIYEVVEHIWLQSGRPIGTYIGDNSSSPFVTPTDSLNPLSTIYRRLTSCIVGCRKSNLHSAGEAEAAFDSGTATVEPVGHAAADRAPRGRQAATVLAPGRQSAAEGVVVRGLQIANEFPGSVIWAARDGGECGASYCCFNL